MANTFGNVLVSLLVIFLFFIAPILYLFNIQDNATMIIIQSETVQFTDQARATGYITPAMYKTFLSKLALTGNVYEVTITHYQKEVDPVYTDPANAGSFTGDIAVNYNLFSDEEVRNVLSLNDTYYMSNEDFLKVAVVNKNMTMATKIANMLYGGFLPKEKFYVNYGGLVRNAG